MLLDPAVPDDQVRVSLSRRVERDALAAALADCERLVRPLDDHFEAELPTRYAMVRQFLSSLLASVEFQPRLAGQRVLEERVRPPGLPRRADPAGRRRSGSPHIAG